MRVGSRASSSLIPLVACFLVGQVFGSAIGQAACYSQGTTPGSSTAIQHQRWSCSFPVEQGSSSTQRKLYAETKLKVTYTYTPSGRTYQGYAFWDGGEGTSTSKGSFVARFPFHPSGAWTWATTCETPTTCSNSTFSRTGTVTVSAASGSHALYGTSGGLVGTSLSFGPLYKGTQPFFWVGDAAWVGPMKSTPGEWDDYLSNRELNSFSVVHIGLATFWAGATDRAGNRPFCQGTGGSGCPAPSPAFPVPHSGVRPNPAFWRTIDDRVKAANVYSSQFLGLRLC